MRGGNELEKASYITIRGKMKGAPNTRDLTSFMDAPWSTFPIEWKKSAVHWMNRRVKHFRIDYIAKRYTPFSRSKRQDWNRTDDDEFLHFTRRNSSNLCG